jgi:hypothetical protein
MRQSTIDKLFLCQHDIVKYLTLRSAFVRTKKLVDVLDDHTPSHIRMSLTNLHKQKAIVLYKNKYWGLKS